MPSDGLEADLATHVLRPREELRWTGRPDPDRARRRHIERPLIGVVLLGFWLYWTIERTGRWSAQSLAMQVFEAAVGIAIVASCLWLIVNPLLNRQRARRTLYAITDQRAIVLIRKALGKGLAVHSIAPHEMHHVRRIERADGTSDIRLRHKTQRDPEDDEPFRIVGELDGLWGIADGAGAAAALDALRAGDSAG